MKINIVGGSGVMGRVHAPVFMNAGHEVILSGRSSHPTPEEAAKDSDVSIITYPIGNTQEIIERVAPHCKAIMDFTSIKQIPLEAMLKYSGLDTEVGGLHPLYGDVNSVKGRTVIYCKTPRSGQRCQAVIDAFVKEGAVIKEMDPEKHDKIVNGALQNARTGFLLAYGSLVEEMARIEGMSIDDIYALSPEPGRIIFDLLARQSDNKNDDLYRQMRENNKFQGGIEKKILRHIMKSFDDLDTPERIRAFFGDELPKAQERAKKYINRKE